MLNQLILIGRLGKDPESKDVSGSTVTKLTVATNNKFKNKAGELIEETQWHNVNVWGPSAEACAKYLQKGSLVHVDGEIQYRSYEKDGEMKYFTEVRANRVSFLSSKTQNQDGPNFDSNEEIPF